jgi:glycosyltransferase involved in cell wall biosynthesis
VAVGNLKEAKNYHYLLEIFKHLKEVKVSLDIYGQGPLHDELKAHVQHEGLNVRLCGGTSNVLHILPQYDFFIQGSSHEGFGLSVIEAMAIGMPVLLSDIPVFRETTNNLATFFPLNNAADAAKIIMAAFHNEELYLSCRSAYEYVRNNYSATPYRQKLLGIYKEVVGDDCKPGLFSTRPLSA